MVRERISDLMMGQNLMFISFGVPNAGKSFSIFGNKLLCDPYFLEFIESIPARDFEKKKQIMNENLGILGFTMWQLLEKVRGTEKVGLTRSSRSKWWRFWTRRSRTCSCRTRSSICARRRRSRTCSGPSRSAFPNSKRVGVRKP